MKKIEYTIGEMTFDEASELLFEQSSRKMIELDGGVLKFRYGAEVVEMSDDDQEEKRVLLLKGADGNVYGTVSSTFIETFWQAEEFCNVQGVKFSAVQVKSGTSKSGRTFIYCVPTKEQEEE